MKLGIEMYDRRQFAAVTSGEDWRRHVRRAKNSGRPIHAYIHGPFDESSISGGPQGNR